ncbi:MAG: hypothetical protein ABW019_04175 [Chitinophagaceae bacterium]
MRMPARDLIVLLKNQFMSQQAIEQEVECLHGLLRLTESEQQFCTAHELVDRNQITRKSKKIIRESRFRELRAFRFLLNKN